MSALDTFVKDMSLVTHAARELTLRRTPRNRRRAALPRRRRAGLGRLDDSSIIELLRARGG
jgi:3-hydroxyisobutyrate dehydrogenase-like beta-hydroxyacid dehydrogenase